MPKSIHRPEYESLRGLIRELRTERDATQVWLSEQLGRSQSFISDIERGVRRIDVLELRDLCQLLGTDLQHFISELERRIARLPPTLKAHRGRRAKPAIDRDHRS